MPNQTDLRKQIAQQIIAALEQDDLPPWRRPWSVSKNTGFPANVISKRPYQGINPLLLELHGRKHGFNSRWWATYHQWQSLGGKIHKRPAEVKSGQWGCKVVFFKPVIKTTVDPATGETDEQRFPMMRQYTLFNADQVDGVEQYRAGEPQVLGDAVCDFQPGEELIAATGADIRCGGDRAFYCRPMPNGSYPNHSDGDFIQLPPKKRYSPVGSYYETAFHELAHWSECRTGWDHDKRGYALSELAAEIGACNLASELGVPHGEKFENHVAYVKGWIKEMQNDPRFIFVASSQASKVTDYLLNFVRDPAESESVGTVQVA